MTFIGFSFVLQFQKKSYQFIEVISAQVAGQVRKIDLLEMEEEGEMIAIDRRWTGGRRR